MEPRRVDRLAVRLASATTRRAAIAVAAALVAGAPLAGSVAARPNATCRAYHRTCTRDAQCCAGTCRTGRSVPVHDRNRCGCDGFFACGECYPVPVSEQDKNALLAMLC